MNVTLSSHRFGATYFFTLNTYRRQALLTYGEVLKALRSAHRVMKLRTRSASTPQWSFPIIFHAVWSLPPEDADYSPRLSLLKHHVSLP